MNDVTRTAPGELGECEKVRVAERHTVHVKADLFREELAPFLWVGYAHKGKIAVARSLYVKYERTESGVHLSSVELTVGFLNKNGELGALSTSEKWTTPPLTGGYREPSAIRVWAWEAGGTLMQAEEDRHVVAVKARLGSDTYGEARDAVWATAPRDRR